MKEKFESVKSLTKGQFVVPLTIALNLMVILSFVLIIVSAIQHFH